MNHLEVLVYRRPDMFKVNDNLYNMMGYGELKKLFTIEDYVCKPQDLKLFFPERFLNILEQRALVDRIKKAENYNTVQIFTHSVYIVQTVNSENIGIMCVSPASVIENGEIVNFDPDKHDSEDRFYPKDSSLYDHNIKEGDWKLSCPNVGLPDDSVLGVL